MNTSVLKEGSVSLSPQDRLILEGYKPLVDAIGQLFGDCCEVVLHSLEDLSHSVIWIHNGAKTGRKIGSPVTDKALSVLRQCEQTGSSFSKLYLTQTVNGATMRSTTTVIKGIAGNPIGLFCINFDISMPFNQLAQILVEPKNEGEAGGEHFAIDLDDLFLTETAKMADVVLPCGAAQSPLDGGSLPAKIAMLFAAEVLVLRYMVDNQELASIAQVRTKRALAPKQL